ncbi:LysR family transcriptional regulator [Flagellimonas meridianipacifica]|uniref:DNA-binding transcriptional LysR family regulator n=1 Tax=Flagellimonas meridianipacifica TaxID=1080225 RepID=A0A2T0M9X1_9FLAO|nr:LysR family transcriptional regulator [Allomuricauda pacifica]PRX54273.1 DNA-binding transcriptional LysR family regulator [Allomuricauda pacifica]
MTTEQLKNFLILCETMNFRKAAEKTYIAQPALSRQIQNLEEEIGAKLFDRSKRQIVLTESGDYFKREISKVLEQITQIAQRTNEIDKGDAGTITIGHASSAMHSIIPSLLQNLNQGNPNLKVSLLEGSNQFIFDRLESNEADFGFVPNALVPSNFDAVEIYRENYFLILPQEHHLDENSFRDLGDCRNEDWILHPQEGYGYMERILQIINGFGYLPNIVHRSPNTSSVLRMVSAGLGITMMGKSTLKGFDLNLKTIELKDLDHKLDMKLVFKKSRDLELNNYFSVIIENLEYLGTKIP